VEVALERPALRWSGAGYLDTNAGSEPLEDAFVRWDWSRTSGRGGVRILYDVTRREEEDREFALALDVGRDGRVSLVAAPDRVWLPRTRWRIARGTRSQAGHPARVLATLEDTPFYARSIISTGLAGEAATSMHESLDLERFRSAVVQLMLPFRMPRVGRRGLPGGAASIRR
jgi:carotenoid 1,2-hydratase